MTEQEKQRVQKVLASIGLGSRRVCEQMIVDGLVTINGTIATVGDRVNELDEVAVNGVVYSTKPDAVTYLLNKPVGCVSTVTDTHGRSTVVDLVPNDVRVFPVGRLDMDTEGLILLTNDGALTHRLTHPSFGVEKEYLVHLKSKPARSAIRSLREGVELDDGMTAPAKVSHVDDKVIRMTIHEGRNRQIRRMCTQVGNNVERLVRLRIGPISDNRLQPGKYRLLEGDEMLKLQQAVETSE